MPFGEELTAGVGARDAANLKYSTSGIDNVRQRFTGYEKDIETGNVDTALDYAQARMYQNRHGRFTAPDPLLFSASLANPQTFNRYVYVGNNPMNLTDPSGLDWCVNNKSGVGTFREGKGTCQSGESDATGKEVPITGGSIKTDNGYVAGVGDVVRLNADGTATHIGATQQRADQEGVQVQDSSDPVEATPMAIGTKISSQTLLPLPCPSGMTCGSSSPAPAPRLDTSNNAPLKTVAAIESLAHLMQLVPGLNAPATIISIAIDIGQGDFREAGEGTVGFIPFGGVLKWGKKTRKISQFGPTHNDLRYLGATDSHHIIQDAAVKNIPGYSRGAAPVTMLPGGGRGTPHHIANQVQKQRGGGTYGAERRIGYKALRIAGLTKSQARYEIGRADAYFNSLGITNSTVLPIPKGRRRR